MTPFHVLSILFFFPVPLWFFGKTQTQTLAYRMLSLKQLSKMEEKHMCFLGIATDLKTVG